MPDKKLDSISAVLLNGAKSLFTKNITIKIISVIFALLIWGYVMMETDPERTKLITNIPVSFSGESDLLSRGLAVRGDQGEILKNINARVDVKVTKYADLDASDISATVSLRTVSKADMYKLKIDAVAKDGSRVISVYPNELTIEVDQLATRVVPIEVEYSGSLSDGYWRSEPTLGSQTLSVSGPAEDVSTVSKAICTIDLNKRISSYNESVLLRYVDKMGREVNSHLFINKLPSVVVKMDILPIATVPVKAADAVLGADALPANYEVYDIVSTPPMVRIVGPESLLKDIEGIDIDKIDVSGKNTSVQTDVALTVPDGITMLDEPTATIYVDIREKLETINFQDVSIAVKGLSKNHTAELSETICDVEITGKASLIRFLERKDVKLYVDLTDLTVGSHQVEIMVSMSNSTLQKELQWVLSPNEVTVTIKE